VHTPSPNAALPARTAQVICGANRLYVDHGTLTLDSTYAPYSERMNAILPTLGWHRAQ
jgi:hypothetical protein